MGSAAVSSSWKPERPVSDSSRMRAAMSLPTPGIARSAGSSSSASAPGRVAYRLRRVAIGADTEGVLALDFEQVGDFAEDPGYVGIFHGGSRTSAPIIMAAVRASGVPSPHPSATRALLVVGIVGDRVPVELASLAREFGIGGVLLASRNLVDPLQVAELAREIAGAGARRSRVGRAPSRRALARAARPRPGRPLPRWAAPMRSTSPLRSRPHWHVSGWRSASRSSARPCSTCRPSRAHGAVPRGDRARCRPRRAAWRTRRRGPAGRRTGHMRTAFSWHRRGRCRRRAGPCPLVDLPPDQLDAVSGCRSGRRLPQACLP